MYIQFPPVCDFTLQGIERVRLPKVRIVRQRYDATMIMEIEAHIRAQMARAISDKAWYAGKRIAITAGSRGIPHMVCIFKTICDVLKEYGAEPFIVPAMGSHGGATAEGQLDILASYGITQQNIGAPVLSSMEVVQYGTLPNGTHLYCDKLAGSADGIVILNKVKPHTDFRGKHESGLVKMMAIGISKHVGAASFHQLGFDQFEEMLPLAGQIFLKNLPVTLGVGIVQNAYDDICSIEFAERDGILAMDARLLEIAKQRMARFKFQSVDLLVLDEIGKNISGYGQDPNVTGRMNGNSQEFEKILRVNKLFIRGISALAHHNGAGIAEADVTTRDCLNSIDWGATWTNIATSMKIRGCKIPMYQNTDLDAFKLAVLCCGSIQAEDLRMARAHNTLCLERIEVSQGLYEQIKEHPDIEALSDYYDLPFDENGKLIENGYY